MEKIAVKMVSVLLFLSGLSLRAVWAAEFDHTHRLFTTVLERYVQNDLVNYTELKKYSTGLNAYLDQLAAVTEKEFKTWSEPQRLAYLINLYNAQTLRLIIDHYPKIKSIKDIGSVFKGPWDQPVVRLFGKKATLNTIEHKILRKRYNEPRVHFALVCAARGCPSLRREAYVGVPKETTTTGDPKTSLVLEEQLEDQGKRFLSALHKNRVDVKVKIVYLSPIFKWFKKDFVQQSGSVLAFLTPYFPPEGARALGQDKFKIKYTDYDWSLNDRSDK